MTTDVAVPQQTSGTGLAIPSPSEAISSVVAQYATDLKHCGVFAKEIIDTPFVPAGLWPAPIVRRGNDVVTLKASGRDGWDFRRRHPLESDEDFTWRRGNAIATTGAIVYSGAILGLNWQAALSGIYVANGRTSLYAEQMRALILSGGHRFEIVTRAADVCTVAVARRGEQDLTEFTFTMREAITAGYVKGKGPNVGQDSWKGNDRYNTNPCDMLFARATSIAAKAKFADVIRGMETRETLDDDRPAPVDITAQVDVTTPTERPTTAAVLAAAGQEASQDHPPMTSGNAEPAPDPAPAVRAVLPITDPQLRMLGAVMAQLGVTGVGVRERRLTIASRVVDRPLQSSKELTKDEASTVLDTLTSILNDPDGPQRLQELEHGEEEPAQDAASVVLDDEGHDPTTEPGWGDLDGAEAAAEGGQP